MQSYDIPSVHMYVLILSNTFNPGKVISPLRGFVMEKNKPIGAQNKRDGIVVPSRLYI